MIPEEPGADLGSSPTRGCKFAAGQRVRIGDRQDVAPFFRQVEGTVVSAEPTDFGCLYRVRLTSLSEGLAQTRPLVFHEEQLISAGA